MFRMTNMIQHTVANVQSFTWSCRTVSKPTTIQAIWSTTIDHWLLSSAQLFFQVQTPTRTALHATFTPRTRVEGSLIWPAPNRQHRPIGFFPLVRWGIWFEKKQKKTYQSFNPHWWIRSQSKSMACCLLPDSDNWDHQAVTPSESYCRRLKRLLWRLFKIQTARKPCWAWQIPTLPIDG